jgi:type I restriction enzyme S subunit
MAENKAFLIHKNDLLIAMSGATTGKFGCYDSDEPALLNQRVGRVLVKPGTSILLRRLCWFFLMFSQKEILHRAYGGAQPNISAQGIHGLEFSFPCSDDETVLLVSLLAGC